MYLKEIRIENFTSFRRSIEWARSLNIVTGQNWVGKTNLSRVIGEAFKARIDRALNNKILLSAHSS